MHYRFPLEDSVGGEEHRLERVIGYMFLQKLIGIDCLSLKQDIEYRKG